MFGRAYAKLVKKDLAHCKIIMLPGVDQNLIKPFRRVNYFAQGCAFDELGPSANDC
jgi:hypothetical protein